LCFIVGPHRKIYYQESRNGLYSGPLFITAHTIANLPYDIITCLIGSWIIFEYDLFQRLELVILTVLMLMVNFVFPFRRTGLSAATDWALMFLVIWTCYTMAKQQTFASMLSLKNKFFAIAFLSAGHALQITLGSSTVRSVKALPDWQYYLTYITQTRYAGAFLSEQIFENQNSYLKSSETLLPCESRGFGLGCRYLNGTHYLKDRYYFQGGSGTRDDLQLYFNFGLCFAFPVVAFLFTLIVYALPLPTLVKQKFRD